MKKAGIFKALSMTLILTGILSMTACGKNHTMTNSKSDTTGVSESPDTAEPTEITFWNVVDDPNNAMSKRFEAVVKEVEKDLNVKINYEITSGEVYHTKLKVAMAGDELPDIFHMYAGPGEWEPLLNSEAAAPLNDVLESSGIGSKYMDGYLIKNSDQNIYSVPFRVNLIQVMYYNKDIFKDLGINPPTTWDEFKNACSLASSKGYNAIGLGEKDRWMGDLIYNTLVLREDPQAFQKALKGEMKYSDKPFLDAAIKVNELVNMGAFQKGYMTSLEADVVENFISGKTAMYSNGSWAFSDLIDKMGDKLGYMPFPATGADTQPELSACGNANNNPYGLAVSAKSKNLEKAKLVAVTISKLYNDYAVKEGEQPYMVTDVNPDKPVNPEFAKYIEDCAKLKFVQTYWGDFLPADITEPYRDLNQALFTGKMDPQKYVNEQQQILSLME